MVAVHASTSENHQRMLMASSCVRCLLLCDGHLSSRQSLIVGGRQWPQVAFADGGGAQWGGSSHSGLIGPLIGQSQLPQARTSGPSCPGAVTQLQCAHEQSSGPDEGTFLFIPSLSQNNGRI